MSIFVVVRNIPTLWRTNNPISAWHGPGRGARLRVTGEPIEVRDSTSLLDRIIEGPGVRHSTATDTQGNSCEAGGRDQQTAEDKAIFGILKNRGDD